MPDEHDKSGPDVAIAAIAARQHGVITRAELVLVGVSKSAISDRVYAGRLHRIHRGVYAVGHRNLSNEGKWMAAVLACGESAVLSHTSAAELWGIRRPRRPSEPDKSAAIHITVPIASGRRRRRGFTLHRSSTLIAGHCTRRNGIPVTNPGRTLADLRPLLSPAQLAAAIREAEFLGLPRAGVRPPDPVRSELEQLFLALCRRQRLPRPGVNVRIDRYEVDFIWADARLIVEVDGWESHRSRSAFEEDRARDARLSVLGYRVLRFTWRQVTDDGAGVAKTIRALVQGDG